MAWKIIRPCRLLDDGTAEIVLTRGKVAIIDAADVALVNDRGWNAVPDKNTWYARGHARGPDGRVPSKALHGTVSRASGGRPSCTMVGTTASDSITTPSMLRAPTTMPPPSCTESSLS